MPTPTDRYHSTNPRHRLMVEMVALGKNDADIAEQIGYSAAYVNAVRHSPLFQTEVAAIQQELKQATLSRFAESLASEALPSLNTLVVERDRVANKATDKINAAAKIIDYTLDVFMGQRKNEDERKHTTKLVIEGGDLHNLVGAIKELEAHPVAQERIAPTTIDEFVAAEATMEEDAL